MALLAVQYGVQPRVSRACLDRRVDKRSVAAVEEVVKIGMAAALLAGSGPSKITEAVKGAREGLSLSHSFSLNISIFVPY